MRLPAGTNIWNGCLGRRWYLSHGGGSINISRWRRCLWRKTASRIEGFYEMRWIEQVCCNFEYVLGRLAQEFRFLRGLKLFYWRCWFWAGTIILFWWRYRDCAIPGVLPGTVALDKKWELFFCFMLSGTGAKRVFGEGVRRLLRTTECFGSKPKVKVQLWFSFLKEEYYV